MAALAAPEVCNGIDDGEGAVEEGPVLFAPDGDSDGWGGASRADLAVGCDAVPSDGVPGADDCHDSSPDLDPSQSETCNGVDDDCDGEVDDGACHCSDVEAGDSSTWQMRLVPDDALSASFACQDDGWHLASIPSEDVQEELHLFVDRYGEEFWIGLHDLYYEGDYVWSDGTELGYTNFDYGEPNDGAGYGEDCFEVEPGGVWEDDSCAEAQPYICELEDGCTHAGGSSTKTATGSGASATRPRGASGPAATGC